MPELPGSFRQPEMQVTEAFREATHPMTPLFSRWGCRGDTLRPRLGSRYRRQPTVQSRLTRSIMSIRSQLSTVRACLIIGVLSQPGFRGFRYIQSAIHLFTVRLMLPERKAVMCRPFMTTCHEAGTSDEPLI